MLSVSQPPGSANNALFNTWIVIHKEVKRKNDFIFTVKSQAEIEVQFSAMKLLQFQLLLLLFTLALGNDGHIWTWTCKNSKCEKIAFEENEKHQSLAMCKLRCDQFANLWPQPTGTIRVSSELMSINPHSVSVEYSGKTPLGDKVRELIQESGRIFQKRLGREAGVENLLARSSQHSLFVQLDISDPTSYTFKSSTDESYQLIVSTDNDNGQVKAAISAGTYFGARHGLETLGQLIVYDDYSRTLVIPANVYLNDQPFYPYRGILLDTSRSYFSVESIKRTLDAMAANKLNTFHWHMTDTHSFPFQSKKYPQFSQYGAYSPRMIYTHEDIKNIVEYGRIRGIRILPELDQPAHVGEGWQWAPNTTVCFKAEPWASYCVEPPCGQLDPTNEQVFQILYDLYTEFLELFDSDLFHMGGDEVNFNCWNNTQKITKWMSENHLGHSEEDFLKLWKRFQDKSYDQLIKANGGKEIPVILWTSHLTGKGHVDKNLDKNKYTIQIWTKGDDEVVPELVEKGFKVIFSNYEALYFDCGFGAWVGTGNNWCSPYINWQKVYENDPIDLLKANGVHISDTIMKQVLGAEATLFSEQADETSVDSRLWPRGSALAERLWSRPKNGWLGAETRLLEHRERLVKLGVMADLLEPEWCRQNPGYCYLK